MKLKENDLDGKLRVLIGHAENASSPTISQGTKFMTLFHLKTLGAGRHIPSFFKF